MTATEKYNEEKENAKTNRKNRILSSAFDLFSEKGIDSIAITDIAKKAEIGVASVYRYFETKDQIVINTAIWAWNKHAAELLPNVTGSVFDAKTGYEKLETICKIFRQLFTDNYLFLRFIYFFDSYIFRQEISKNNFDEYEKSIKFVKDKIIESIESGINDNSIKIIEGYTASDLYYTMMHSLFSMVQKLSLSQNLLTMNEEVPATKQIDLLIKMLLSSLKA